MKTVYTLTEAQFRVLARIEGHMSRDPEIALSRVLRRGCAADLATMLDSVVGTATVQIEPHDRKAWQGEERRNFDRRTLIDQATKPEPVYTLKVRRLDIDTPRFPVDAHDTRDSRRPA